jgi:hypothetical protein
MCSSTGTANFISLPVIMHDLYSMKITILEFNLNFMHVYFSFICTSRSPPPVKFASTTAHWEDALPEAGQEDAEAVNFDTMREII